MLGFVYVMKTSVITATAAFIRSDVAFIVCTDKAALFNSKELQYIRKRGSVSI